MLARTADVLGSDPRSTVNAMGSVTAGGLEGRLAECLFRKQRRLLSGCVTFFAMHEGSETIGIIFLDELDDRLRASLNDAQNATGHRSLLPVEIGGRSSLELNLFSSARLEHLWNVITEER